MLIGKQHCMPLHPSKGRLKAARGASKTHVKILRSDRHAKLHAPAPQKGAALRPKKGRLMAARGAPPRRAREKVRRADRPAALHAPAPQQGAAFSGAWGAA